jgi:UDP-galactopyranose mutase
MKATVVGAGISGLTAATLLKIDGWDVEVFETRETLGGNCHDYEEDSILIHTYGPHIFHTEYEDVWEFVNQFAQFNNYRHRVQAETPFVPDKPIPIPYSRATEDIIGRAWTDHEIVESLFVEYSQKMWGKPWNELPEEITNRVPKRRDDFNEEYFTDKYQGMPIGGYTEMFKNMVDVIGEEHVHLGVSEDEWKISAAVGDLVVYTGSIDSYFNYSLGELPYRTLDFKFTAILSDKPQPVAVINQCNNRKFTRKTDFSHFYEYKSLPLLLPMLIEYPRQYVRDFGDEPIYPMNWGNNDRLASGYKAIAHQSYGGEHVIFCGRLGKYKYLDMDDAVKEAMDAVAPYLKA